jgi:hypothetical protein
MHAKRGGARLIGLIAAATLVGMALGGCSSGKAGSTVYMVEITRRPAATPTPALTATPQPSVDPSPTATPSGSAEPSTSAIPSSAGPTPTPAKAVPASRCAIRGASNKTFWAKASRAMSWNVYCPVLPAGWYVSAEPNGIYDNTAKPSGVIWIVYTGPNGARFRVYEGSFCLTSAAACSAGTTIGPADFADMQGTLKALATGGYGLYVRPGSNVGYTITGSNITQSLFVSFAQGMVKVAKS